MTRWPTLIALIAALLASCTDAGVQPIDRPAAGATDDLLEVRGRACTATPEDVVFPVKIMVIVDASGSMQFTDPSDATTTSTVTGGSLKKGVSARATCLATCATTSTPPATCQAICRNANNPGRQAAVQELVDRFRNNPAVSFAIIRFNGRISVNGAAITSPSQTGGGFTNNEAKLKAAVRGLTESDITTDYQGALATAYQVLLDDMRRTSPVARARTKYVIIFLSDGGPNPVCKKGCGNDKHPVITNADDWCDLPRSQWCRTYSLSPSVCADMKNWYPHLVEPCQAYNTPAQIVAEVRKIVALGKQYAVGDIRFNTAFLFVPTLPKAVLDLMAVDPVASEKLLRDMAKAGDGVFRNFSTGQQIDFLSFNYATIARPFGMTNLVVTNTSARLGAKGTEADSDGDGLPDATEIAFRQGIRADSADSDGDGYGDLLEYRRRAAGFHPGDKTRPYTLCPAGSRTDDDGDGLNACEERVLGTQPKIADTDRDRVPDGLEVRFGTDPLKPDLLADADFDGKLSGEEIRMHTDPLTADADRHADNRYVYGVRSLPAGPDGRRCYDFTVGRVRLATTRERGGDGTLGFNDILVYFGEGPADDPLDYGSFKAACVRAQYVAPSFKAPVTGRVTVPETAFAPLPALRASIARAKRTPACRAPSSGRPCTRDAQCAATGEVCVSRRCTCYADPCAGVPLARPTRP